MLAEIERLKRRDTTFTSNPNVNLSNLDYRPQYLNQTYNPVASSYQNIGRYLTKDEAKLAVRNTIASRVPDSKLQDSQYCFYLDAKFDSAFDRLRGYDDKINESKLPQLTNDMLA
jgi:hypothetical protein